MCNNSLPRMAAMTAHILSCRTASTIRLSTERVEWFQETNGAKFCHNLIRPSLYLASIHQMAPPKRGSTHLIIALLLIYRPRKDEKLSWPSWLTCSWRFIPISGHQSAAGQAQDRESSPAKYRRWRSTTATQQTFIGHLAYIIAMLPGEHWAHGLVVNLTRSSAIAERPRCSLFKLW